MDDSSVDSVGPLKLRKSDFSAVSRWVRSVHARRFSVADFDRYCDEIRLGKSIVAVENFSADSSASLHEPL